ncbi:MAG: 3-oxoacyl-[acyl-carrier-protein] reductase [Akkermansiaceae bacterium]|jgi:3-oxoacyl-[acyl-carrier protein] reductase|nr:3-oxoacyl-[acyl-carrier-protein] reductase [Akkermansiaceae bacterium]MDP4645671.1 3-oxoacyl-[acyl-carrier-protein] reductase [Akkermansiaceae bacterium]MDP4719918.1 3-oxoacyl-[acyl-carrier-protein] reductase [Akkermansiaceae bacterium]MDP4778779.1 3-oxoacyl-[acyl-carrier-protein] reductase [Akkermansiaceae bacterium]MDP4847019.1 3-oxoacyl-[acyl-carrier-protein] reductase [Akkermansiaceae bacterium]
MTFTDKVVAVTGAGRGIGQEIARAFASQGAKVALISRSASSCGGAAEEINKTYPGSCTAYPVDVADHEAVAVLAKKIADEMGAVNILVNNAGVTRDGLLMRMKEDDWDTVLDTNLKGAFNTVKAFMRPMMKGENSRIINIASVIGLIGNAGQANYSASKAGLIGFTKAVARELAGRAVTCNAIAPGFITTDMTDELPDNVKEAVIGKIPLASFGTTDDIAQAVLFLASPAARYVTGQVIAVDGGMTM